MCESEKYRNINKLDTRTTKTAAQKRPREGKILTGAQKLGLNIEYIIC